jgi:hypothetical protein
MDIDALQTYLGVFVGQMTQDEVVDAIAAHTGPGAELVMQMTAPNGELVWHKHGELEWHLTTDDVIVLVIRRVDEQSAGNPLVNIDAPLVLSFIPDDRFAERLDAEQYSGGVRVRFDFGPYRDHTLTIVFWRSVMHVTESGDVAPGFGGFDLEMKEGDGGEDD